MASTVAVVAFHAACGGSPVGSDAAGVAAGIAADAAIAQGGDSAVVVVVVVVVGSETGGTAAAAAGVRRRRVAADSLAGAVLLLRMDAHVHAGVAVGVAWGRAGGILLLLPPPWDTVAAVASCGAASMEPAPE